MIAQIRLTYPELYDSVVSPLETHRNNPEELDDVWWIDCLNFLNRHRSEIEEEIYHWLTLRVTMSRYEARLKRS